MMFMPTQVQNKQVYSSVRSGLKMMALPIIVALAGSLLARPALANAPSLRVKNGFTSLKVDAGERLKGESLTPIITFQPSLLWDVPEFSARMGVHYLQELGGAFGTTPLSGVGVSFYYYMLGISSSYQKGEDEVLVQRSKPGPYIIASFSPVNFNLNRLKTGSDSTDFYFSSIVYDISTGFGYDYPLTRALLLSGEVLLRNGSGVASNSTNVSYTGLTFFVSVGMTYY